MVKVKDASHATKLWPASIRCAQVLFGTDQVLGCFSQLEVYKEDFEVCCDGSDDNAPKLRTAAVRCPACDLILHPMWQLNPSQIYSLEKRLKG